MMIGANFLIRAKMFPESMSCPRERCAWTIVTAVPRMVGTSRRAVEIEKLNRYGKPSLTKPMEISSFDVVDRRISPDTINATSRSATVMPYWSPSVVTVHNKVVVPGLVRANRMTVTTAMMASRGSAFLTFSHAFATLTTTKTRPSTAAAYAGLSKTNARTNSEASKPILLRGSSR